jgi:hypothetical protein
MFKKITVTVLFVSMSLFVIAQKNINNYKYVLIPKSFDFTKGEDQYQLNSITKFLFNKYGYEAYFIGDDMPEDVRIDRCLALSADVVDVKGGFLKTKLEIVLKDCFGAVVMTSKVGDSKLKKFNRAYNEALREAFVTYRLANYKYTPLDTDTIIESNSKKVVEQNIENKDVIVKSTQIEESDIEKAETLVTDKAFQSQDEKVVVEEVTKIEENSKELYYAQAIANGYQLVNSEPRIVMVLLKSGAKDVFIVKGKNAIVFKEDGFWYYSENNAESSSKKKLNIKF